MGNGTQAFAIAAEQREQENYMRTAELSTEQNYNMIDGQINNTPSVDELEEKAKRGEVISLSALATAVKAEDKVYLWFSQPMERIVCGKGISGYLRYFRIRRCIFPRSRRDTAFSLLSARMNGVICRCASSIPLSGRSSKRNSQKSPLHQKRQRQRRKTMIWRYEHGQCFVHH